MAGLDRGSTRSLASEAESRRPFQHRQRGSALGAFAYPNAKPEAASMRLASRLDLETLQWVEEGGRLLLLPDGKTGSFPIADHWFLRGGAIISDHPGIDPVFRRMIADLQNLRSRWTGDQKPRLSLEVTPLVLLWDNHDLDHYKTHALVFEMGVGKGRILVSTLNHDPDRGPAASYTLARFARILLSDQNVRPLSAESLTQLRSISPWSRVCWPRKAGRSSQIRRMKGSPKNGWNLLMTAAIGLPSKSLNSGMGKVLDTSMVLLGMLKN